MKQLKNISSCKVEIEEIENELYIIHYWDTDKLNWSLKHPEYHLIPKEYHHYRKAFNTLLEAIKQVKLFNCFDITVLYLDGREEKH